MKEIKKFNKQERQSYVPASVKVIEVTAQRVMCTSPSSVDGNFWSNSEEEEI